MKNESAKIKLRENQNKRIKRQLSHKIKLLKTKNPYSKRPLEMKILRILKSSNMNWFNILKWPAELIDDIRQWLLVRTALEEPETLQAIKSFKYELRVDRIGRLYTVINIPEELWPFEKQGQVWPWMVEQLRELDDLLLERQLNDLLYPEVTPIEGSPAYLVILSPSVESLKWSKFFGWIFRAGFLTATILFADRIAIKSFGQSIVELLASLFN